MSEDECIRAAKNLLARIHRDGGHHTGDVGFIQSCKDANSAWCELMIDKAELMLIGDDMAKLLLLYIENTHGVPVSIEGRTLRECAVEQVERYLNRGK